MEMKRHMKRICIVTVYNSINSGSYWQAFVLGKFLEKHNYEVKYLERKGNGNSSNKFKNMFNLALRISIKHGIGHGSRILKQFFEFKKYEKNFTVIDDKSFSQIDCFVLGSDTIWNVESSYFADNRSRYWGGDFAGYRTISYAASVGNTSIETVRKFPDLLQAINRLSAISVRDIRTRDVISELTEKNVELVCDPTLLWSKADYYKYVGEKPEKKYIFLYLFKPLNHTQMSELRRVAAKNNLQIFSGAGIDKGCDKYIVNSPYEFIRYMYYADFVVTDTFHGTIFSANFEKKFAVIKRSKNKVDEFLKSVHLLDQLTDGSNFQEVFMRNINYSEIATVLQNIRGSSKAYLLNAIEENAQ